MMFCYQCQEAAKGTGCNVRGVCGKTEDVAKLQDLLIYTLKGIADIIKKDKLDVKELSEVNHKVIESLFMTITNVNFDSASLENKIDEMISLRDSLKSKGTSENYHDAATFQAGSLEEKLKKAEGVGVLSTQDEDIRSLKEMNIYGLKGIAAYLHHAINLNKDSDEITDYIYDALAATLDDSLIQMIA